MNILVLCTGNSARSILLESILNECGQGRVHAFSAGSQPVGKVNPHALALLDAKGHETKDMRSKSWDEFAAADAPEMDLVITVCGNAADEVCPVWPGAPITAHWGTEDPAAAPEDEKERAFLRAYEILGNRAKAFLALPVNELSRATLASEIDRIGVL